MHGCAKIFLDIFLVVYCIVYVKTVMISMSVKGAVREGPKALVDMSAKYVSLFWTAPLSLY